MLHPSIEAKGLPKLFTSRKTAFSNACCRMCWNAPPPPLSLVLVLALVLAVPGLVAADLKDPGRSRDVELFTVGMASREAPLSSLDVVRCCKRVGARVGERRCDRSVSAPRVSNRMRPTRSSRSASIARIAASAR
jgi:hypothetical protein